MPPAMKPMVMAAQVSTKAQPPVMATRPASAPFPGMDEAAGITHLRLAGGWARQGRGVPSAGKMVA